MAPGSELSPVCTRDGWIVVLAGATSQPKRSEGGSFASGPPVGLPAATQRPVRELRLERGGERLRTGPDPGR